MIATEDLKKIRFRDLIITICAALVWSILAYIINVKYDSQVSYIISLILLTFLLSFILLLIKKAGIAFLFYILCGFFTSRIDDLGATGSNKIIVLVLVGVIFEIVFLILKLEIKNIPLDIVLGTAISIAGIPIATALVLSFNVASVMIIPLINITFLSFFVGLGGSIMSFLIGYYLRTNKTFLKFTYTP